MHLEEIWRYPVKSMAGEQIEETRLERTGVPGDRVVQVRAPATLPNGEEGERIVTARSRSGLLRHRATLDASGEALVDGLPWRSPEVARWVERAAGAGARLEQSDDVELRFDILPLLVATDGAIAAVANDASLAGLSIDRRRFRPNLLLGGVEGLAERGWEGRRLRIGEAVVGLADLRGRCVMTTFDPDSGVQRVEVLRTIAQRLGGVLGLNAEVVRPGRVRRGDPVELVA